MCLILLDVNIGLGHPGWPLVLRLLRTKSTPPVAPFLGSDTNTSGVASRGTRGIAPAFFFTVNILLNVKIGKMGEKSENWGKEEKSDQKEKIGRFATHDKKGWLWYYQTHSYPPHNHCLIIIVESHEHKPC